MSLGSVITTFVMCILFNILLPTGDVGSDLNLLYQTYTFNLGDSFELEGCKSCYHKSDKEVYHPEKDLTSNKCKICLFNPGLDCGGYTNQLKKINQMEREKQNCSKSETFRAQEDEDKLIVGECDEMNDLCCITKTSEIKNENLIQKMDSKKLFYLCESFTNELDICMTSGRANGLYCEIFWYSTEFDEQLEHRINTGETSSTNESIFFYPYAKINETWVMEETNHSITDPNIECGLLIFRHNNNYKCSNYNYSNDDNDANDYNNYIDYNDFDDTYDYNDDNDYNEQRQQEFTKYSTYCNEDSCLTHLKSLHMDTPITDLNEWRKRTEYTQGIKVGGVTCRLLRIFGNSILIPIFLNLTFNMVMFVNDFRDQKANIFEVIPLVLLFYPQYKTMKFLTRFLFIHRDENLLKQERKENDCTVATLEPFLESCLQVRN